MEPAGDVAKRWAAKLAAAVPDWERGINNVSGSPTAKAADAAPAYLNGVQRAVNTQKFQNALRAVSEADWKRLTIQKGRERLAGGAQAAVPKMTTFLNEMLPAQEQIRQRVMQMPGDTREARMARAMEMMRAMAEWGDNRRR